MKRLRNELRPGRSTIAATTTTTMAATRSSERRSRDAENSSGRGSASTGSRYSTVKVGRSLIRESQPERAGRNPCLCAALVALRRTACSDEHVGFEADDEHNE